MLSEQSLTYASHITTFCTAVDMYRPLYGILENVVNMASTRTGLEEQNVLSQLVACLVSMGYQVNQYIMDSWTYGSCQQRSRIILTIAAPGLDPILQRPHTHSRSYEETSARSLGRLPSGERFGDREHYATPFPHVTAREANSDLPDIGNGNVQTCIRFPDHRLSRPTNNKARALIECIPITPPGYGYNKAFQSNLIPSTLRLTKKETAKSYQRIKATGLIPTITTDVNLQDARNGASVHWSQHRPLSIQEAKRTQGYKDHEPIIGTLGEQWKILGNGVDRKVSYAIGLALRDAFGNSKHLDKPCEFLEDPTELVVDAEEEEPGNHLPEQRHYLLSKVDREVSPSSSLSSSSTDSFSSSHEIQQSIDLTLPLDRVHDIDLPLRRSSLTPLPKSLQATTRPAQNEDLDSRQSSALLTIVGRHPTSVPSTLPLMAKRLRDDLKGRVQDAPTAGDDSGGPLKRMKIAEVRRTTSPARVEPKFKINPKGRTASMPPLPQSNHTRRSGPAERAPKAWHKKIGRPENVIDLT